jgi:type IV secretory pathway protease TraF
MTCPGSENGSRRCYWLAKGTGGALMLGIALAGTAGLRVNATASMPQGIWQVEAPGARIGRGEIVSVCLPQSPALNEAAERGYIPAGACPGGHEPLVSL